MEHQHPGGWGFNLHEIKQQLHQKADKHEIHTLHSHVDRLECSLREFSTEIVCLRATLQEMEVRLSRDGVAQ